MIRKMRKLGRKYGNTIVCIVNYGVCIFNYGLLFHSDKIQHFNVGKHIFISTGMGIVSSPMIFMLGISVIKLKSHINLYL